jgi:hypothetical protein
MVTSVDARTFRKLLQETSYPSRVAIAPSVILSLVAVQGRLPASSPFVMHVDGPGSVFDEPVTWEDVEWE